MDTGKVVTVTLNPSLDKTLITNHLNIGYHNRVADTTHLDAGGRGVNVSRALDRLNMSTHALVLLGADAIGHAYRGLLSEERFPAAVLTRPGPTRSDTIILDRGENLETHIIDEGAAGTPEVMQKVTERLLEVVRPGDKVVLAGLLPRDAAPDTYLQLAQAVQQAEAYVTVMTRGEALVQVLKAKPDLVVLTRLDAETLFNYPVRTDADMISGGHKLREMGVAEALTVAEDYTNAVLVAGDETWITELQEAGPGTGTGAVDAMLAGYLAGLLQGLPIAEAFGLGAASMNYAASHIGNVFGTLDEVRPYLHRVTVKAVESRAALL